MTLLVPVKVKAPAFRRVDLSLPMESGWKGRVFLLRARERERDPGQEKNKYVASKQDGLSRRVAR